MIEEVKFFAGFFPLPSHKILLFGKLVVEGHRSFDSGSIPLNLNFYD